TYTWSITHDFTATSPRAANPDHDSYGGTPWFYLEGTANAHPSTFTKIPGPFSTSVDGGLSGWADGNTFVAKNTSGSAVANVPAHDLAMQPDANKVAAIEWKSPFSRQKKV